MSGTAITIRLTDEISPLLERKIEALKRRRPLHAAMGKRLEVELRAHFLEKNSRGNKNGWPSKEFWRAARRATSLTQYDESGATVDIAFEPMPQKVFGGTIRPKEAQILAIPARQEAAGVSPKSFSDLRFVPLSRSSNPNTVGMLVQTDYTKLRYHGKDRLHPTAITRGKTLGGLVFYWLVKEVHQDPDPTALPPAGKLDAAVRAEASMYFERH